MFSRLLASIVICCSIFHAQERPVAFVDVTVVPMDRERILPHQTVMTERGTIKALGPNAKVRVPKNAQRIEGNGRFLMPGLADMHVHLNIRANAGILKNEDYAALFIANGVTTVRNMWGNADILAFRRAIAQGAVLGPQIYTTGPLTDGKPPIRSGSRVVETIAEAVDAVTSDKQNGYDGIKIYDRLSPEAYLTIIETAKKLGFPVYGHVPTSVGVEKVIDSHQNSIEHVEGYLTALDRDDSPTHVSALATSTRDAGVWNCLTLVFYQGAVPPDEGTTLLAKPSMQYVPLAARTAWIKNPQLASLTPYQFSRIRLYDEKRIRFVKALHSAGARILLGTDTPNQYIVPGFAVHEELQNLVNAGFTPFEAIQAGTSGAAEFLHSQKLWGTVAVGLRADLILLSANPLDDVGNASHRVGVMANGIWISEADLEARLNTLRGK